MSNIVKHREARNIIAMGFVIFILLMIDTPLAGIASGMQ